MQRRLIRRSLFGAAASVLACAVGAQTTIPKPSFTPQWPPLLFNPQPADGDFLLPLPCGGAMTFRRVDVPVSGPLDDYGFMLGGHDDEMGFAESRYESFVSGGFADEERRFYWIAKYELNQAQYQAVHAAAECPAPTPRERLPQTGLGWYDATRFADQLNQWLLENAPYALPLEDGRHGFVRLPTEPEWEFAARGGIAVSQAQLVDRTFPMKNGIGDYVWHAGTQSANGKAQMVGLTKPNPLGLHDMLGNVDEIVLEPFRLNRGARLHGHAGGFIVRGGNYLTPVEEVRTAQREEVPFYTDAGPRRTETTGVRFVINVPALTSLRRVAEVRTAWERLGSDSSGRGEGQNPQGATKAQSDALDELATLREESADEDVRQRLAALQAELKASNVARDEQRDRAAKSMLRLGAFLCRKLKTDGELVDTLLSRQQILCKEGERDASCSRRAKLISVNRTILAQNLEYYADTIVGGALDFSPALLSAQHGVLSQEVAAKGSPEIGDWARLYLNQIERFSDDGRISRRGWLDGCKQGI